MKLRRPSLRTRQGGIGQRGVRHPAVDQVLESRALGVQGERPVVRVPLDERFVVVRGFFDGACQSRSSRRACLLL